MKRVKAKSSKSPEIEKVIHEALCLLESVGLSFANRTPRSQERMAMSFLAVAGVTKNWKQARSDTNLRTRDVIQFINEHFQEEISSGSYDDIRRKDLKLLVQTGLIVNTGEGKGAAINDPTRSYRLAADFHKLILTYQTKQWDAELASFRTKIAKTQVALKQERELQKIHVRLPDKRKFTFSPGQHNELQKAVVEEFLPRFGGGCEVLYIGDTAQKILICEKEKLHKLKFFELSHGKLPDVVAYNEERNWLFLIEAVHSSGVMSTTRINDLKRLLQECQADIVYITAFLTREVFKKWMLDIAWETEVWIADNPDHLIHFNGHKFLGPY